MALNFPAKIYQILENESADIIRWHGNGCAFRIVDHGRFEREIIPKYFRHNQLSSVQRQLNLYGFKCISRGEDKGAFFHPRFRRGDWEIVKKITRYAPPKKVMDGPVYDGGSTKLSAETILEMNGGYNGMMNAAKAAAEANYNPNSFESHNFGFHAQPFNFMNASTGTQAWSDWNAASKTQSFNIEPSTPHTPGFSFNPTPYSNSNNQTDGAASTSDHSSIMIEESNSPRETKQQPENQNGFIQVKNSVVKVDPYFDLDAELEMFFENDLPLHNHTSIVHLPLQSVDTMQVMDMMATSPAPSSLSSSSSSVKPERCEIGINTDLSQAAGNLHELYASCVSMFGFGADGLY